MIFKTLSLTTIGVELLAVRRPQSSTKRRRRGDLLTKEDDDEVELKLMGAYKGRYTIDLARLAATSALQLVIGTGSDDDEGDIVDVSVDMSRVLRHHGWERISIESGSAKHIRAYRTLVST